MNAIECKRLVKNFGDPPTEVLRSVSFSVKEGEFVAITGRSGSGKSTLLYVMSGLDNPTAGEARIFGENIHGLEKNRLHRFRNLRMGFVFQFHYLIPELTALDNILMPARKYGKEKEKRSRALDFLSQFELGHCTNKYPSQMSGGEQQRVAVARALLMEPDILFADEPTGNLDSVNGEKVLRIFEKINREHRATIMLVTHENDFAARAAREIHLMDGKIVYDRIQEHGRTGAAP
ncbi:MAG TPA: ABC transporter ATP-binding protein [Spirochaetota bacterium]|nr:ABC transporter ATP-binding protein [Spirochaetota bacterium]